MDTENDSFYKAILSLQTEDECRDFFETFWSHRESLDMIKRWHVFVLLSQGLTQSRIKSIVEVSKYKITRVSKTLKAEPNGCRSIITRITGQGNITKGGI